MTAKANVTGGAMISTGGALIPVLADAGPPGDQGNAGWTPVLAGEQDGTRTLIKVIDWTGSTGTNKPQVGMYIGATGYITAKSDAFNFNAAKRVMSFSGLTNTQGIAAIDMSAAKFATVPAIIVVPASVNLLAGPTRSTMVSGSASKTSVQVKVEQQALVTGVVSVLAGATANILVIET